MDGSIGFWAAEPPAWAKDTWNGDNASKCGLCCAWETIVRPGKTQCDACGGDEVFATVIKEARLSPAPKDSGG
jgi:hypothetical protein